MASAGVGIGILEVARMDRALNRRPSLARRFFTDEEAEYVRDGEDTGVRFAKIWIRKEAYSKYTGKGLADFSNFSVNDGERFYGKVNGGPVKRLNVSFPGSNEYLFAVAGDNI